MNEEGDVNVEELMQQIRRQILEKKAAESADDAARRVPVGGARLPADFYDHLYQAGLSYNQIHAQEHVVPSTVPLLGPLLDRLRRKFHELSLFYVNKMAGQQIAVNMHLLRALSILSEALEREVEEEDGAAR